MSKLLLIDANNIGYASQHGTKLHCHGREVQAIFHFIKTLQSLMKDHRGYTPIILWDGKANHRFEIHPTYKEGRNKTPQQKAEKEKYVECLPDIKKAVALLGVRQMLVSNLEADDLAGYFSMRATANKQEVKLISGDQDWLQLVSDYVVWFDPKLDKIVTAGNFAEKTGYATQRQFLEGKALTGDSSDAIPGVGGLGDVGAVDFMAEYGSVKGFLAEAKAGSLPGKLPVALQRFLDNKPFTYRKKEYPPMIGTFVRNMKLMDLMNVEKPDPELTKIISLPLNQPAFENFCSELAFQSILKNIDVWIAPFKGA